MKNTQELSKVCLLVFMSGAGFMIDPSAFQNTNQISGGGQVKVTNVTCEDLLNRVTSEAQQQ